MTRREFALALIDAQAVQFGAFRLKHHQENPDAPLSPIYVNFRLLRSYPKLLAAAVDLLAEQMAGVEADLLADIPTAVTPLVAVLSQKTGLPMISPRPEKKKGYGLENTIDGVFQPGQRVILLDDLITRAKSKLEAIEVLEAARLKVTDILVLVDREQGGAAELAARGYRLHTVLGLGEMLDLYVAEGRIAADMAARVREYLRS